MMIDLLLPSQGISASPSQSVSSPVSSLSTYNDTNTMNSSKSSPLRRGGSLPPSRRGVSPYIRSNSQLAAHSPGTVDEEMFIKSFEDVPILHFSSVKELEDELTRIRDWLGEKNIDWTKRIDGLKRLRSVLMSHYTGIKEFLDWFRGLELAFIPCVKDLRSQVVRETCFTIAYISQKLGLKATRFCEMLLPILISLIPNSAKIMSSSATVAIRFIIQNTRSPRFIQIIAYNMNSKSKEIRKACCEFLDQILHTWPTSCLEKHGIALQEAIKKGISDADPEARQFARKAFWGFADHFRESADALLQSLDPSKQRILNGHGEAFAAQHQSPVSSWNRNSGRGSTGSLSQVDGSTNGLTNGITNGHSNSKLPTSLMSSSFSSFSSSLTTPSIRKVSTGTGSLESSPSSQNVSNHTKVPVINTTTTTTTTTTNNNNNINNTTTTNRSSIHNSSTTAANQPTSYLPRIRCTLNRYPTSTSLSSSPSSSTSSSSPSPGSSLNYGSTFRSTSAIDADAARRARTRAFAVSSTIKPRVSSMANGSNDNVRRKITPPVVANKSRDSGWYVASSADIRQRYPVISTKYPSDSPLSRSFTNGSSVPPSR